VVNKDWKQYVIKKENFVSEYRQLVSGLFTDVLHWGWAPEVSFAALAAVNMMMR